MAALIERIERAWFRRNASAVRAAEDGRLPVTIVTGASEGIGRALTTTFAEHGHNLLLVARNEDKLNEVAETLRKRFPALIIATLPADLTHPESCERVEAALNENGWFADYLVNNAGIAYSGRFQEQPRENILRLLDLNIRAVADLMARFLPAMLERGSGGILNVASIGGLVPGPYQANYYASKAYAVSLTEAVAHEIAGRGVRLSVLAPGPVSTDFHARMGADTAIYTHLPGLMMNPEHVARVAYRNFMAWQTVIVPGVLPMFLATISRFIPKYLITPFIALILKPKEPRK